MRLGLDPNPLQSGWNWLHLSDEIGWLKAVSLELARRKDYEYFSIRSCRNYTNEKEFPLCKVAVVSKLSQNKFWECQMRYLSKYSDSSAYLGLNKIILNVAIKNWKEILLRIMYYNSVNLIILTGEGKKAWRSTSEKDSIVQLWLSHTLLRKTYFSLDNGYGFDMGDRRYAVLYCIVPPLLYAPVFLYMMFLEAKILGDCSMVLREKNIWLLLIRSNLSLLYLLRSPGTRSISTVTNLRSLERYAISTQTERERE